VSFRAGEKVRRTKMRGGKEFLFKMSIARELLSFLWAQKLWWLIPMVFLLVVFGLIHVFAQGSAIAPFIYTLF
jgi:hypothetical protein